jgi:ATP-dependent DNA helicase RecQ
MLEKDFYDKYNFKVIISRPQSVFTKAFVCVDRKYENKVLSPNMVPVSNS